MTGKAYHVVLAHLQWAVIRFGDLTPLSLHARKDDAVREAQRLGARDGAEVVVFDLGGCPVPPTTCEPEGPEPRSKSN